MPTRTEMDTVTGRIEEMEAERYRADGEWMRPSDDPDSTPWGDLTEEQKYDVLMSEMLWSGFEVDQIADVSRRVVEGESPEFWMDGIAASDQVEHDEKLFAEWREDEQAARVRDFEGGGEARGDALFAGASSVGEPRDMPWHDSGRKDELDEIYQDMTHPPESGGIYQIWHKNPGPTWTDENFSTELPYEFPRDYTHVGNIKSDGLDRAYWTAQNELHDDIDSYSIKGGWQALPGVEALVANPRSTNLDDVVVEPSGSAHFIKPFGQYEKAGRSVGGDAIRSSSDYDRMLDEAAQRGKHRVKDKNRGIDR